MSSADRYRLIWSIVLLAAIIALYFAHAPATLIGPLFTLFPRDPMPPEPRADARPQSPPRAPDWRQAPAV
jgi:hypothetical protein